jgi:DNA-binding NarL/FixJ family response regulator
MKPPIRLVVADDHELIRQGLHTMLRKNPDITIVGEAANGLELVEKVRLLNPDVVITDIQMPVMDGIEATRQLKNEAPDRPIIALTMFNEEALIIDMLEARANGYLLKNASSEELTDAVVSVYEGESYFCQSTSATLARLIGTSRIDIKLRPKVNFSPTEIRIMQWICEERQNKDIALSLNMSVRTVEGYRERIFEKTGAKNIAGIAIYAVRHGYYGL